MSWEEILSIGNLQPLPHPTPLPKMVYYERKEFVPVWGKFVSFRVDFLIYFNLYVYFLVLWDYLAHSGILEKIYEGH